MSPYRLLIALDSFKGSLPALPACQALESGLRAAFERAGVELECELLPISDGGEGLLDSLEGADSSYHSHYAEVLAPYGERVRARYLLNGRRAVLEMAQSSGLTLTPEHRRRAKDATSYGLGEMIAQAYAQGAREIVLGVGGSASNDAGAGCLQALGARFYNASGERLDFAMSGGRLSEIERVEGDCSLKDLRLTLLTDVSNPLLGAQGATFIYGRQKGVQEGDLEFLESQMSHFANVLERSRGGSWRDLPGSGAAGGVAFGLRAFCGAEVRSGAQAVLELISASSHITRADVVITGEGCLDSQSAYGKAPIALARLARELNTPCIGVAGTLGEGYECLHGEGLAAMFSLINAPMSLESAISRAPTLLHNLGQQLGGMLLLGRF